jgi:hypothetical protein
MEELIQLRESIEKQDLVTALQIVDELEEMSVEDKLNKIFNYMIILLLHLIKENAEKRLTKSWKLSINNAVKQISLFCHSPRFPINKRFSTVTISIN